MKNVMLRSSDMHLFPLARFADTTVVLASQVFFINRAPNRGRNRVTIN